MNAINNRPVYQMINMKLNLILLTHLVLQIINHIHLVLYIFPTLIIYIFIFLVAYHNIIQWNFRGIQMIQTNFNELQIITSPTVGDVRLCFCQRQYVCRYMYIGIESMKEAYCLSYPKN